MIKYIIKRFLMMVFTLFLVAAATFFLMRAIPGGPFTTDRVLPPEVEAAVEAKYNLDQPLINQFFDYIWGLLHFDFGPSYVFRGLTVNDMIESGWPPSAILGLLATLLIVVVGIPLGILAALRRNRLTDRIIMLICTIAAGIPSYVIGMFLLYFFAVDRQILPSYGVDSWLGYIMPTFCLAIGGICGTARLTRSSMLDAQEQDYVRTAKSKGLSPRYIVIHHVLRNSLIPVVTSLGLTFAALLTGTFAIESIFAVPGLGQHFVNTITNRDYTAVMGMTVLSSAIMLLAVFIIDIIYGILDPRIKLYER